MTRVEPHVGVPRALVPWAPREVALAVVSVVAVASPFLLVNHPPITDLPQQVAQIRLFGEAWRDPAAGYAIQWTSPNRLSYVLLGAGWALFGPEHAGRAALIGLGVLWAVAAHAVARRRGRPAEAAVVASLLFFNHTTYWGFLSFSCGLPAFVLLVHVADRAGSPPSWRDRARLAAVVLLLWLAHALWLAAGLVWLAVSTLAARGPRATVSRLVTVSPVVAWAALWNARQDGGTIAGASWGDLAARLRLERWIETTLGGLRGPFEDVVFAALAAWLLLGALAAATSGRGPARTPGPGEPPGPRGWDRPLLGAAALLAAGALVLPEGTRGTIAFAARWLPMAAFLAVLAVPAAPARVRAAVKWLVPAGALAFAAWTGAAWRTFERTELTGLDESLAALPEEPRVLGLDFVKDSAIVRGRPFLQTFAEAQVRRGGELAFTFAVHPSSLVVLAAGRRESWTPNLAWNPERVRRDDADAFDHVLVNALDDASHARWATALGLSPVTTRGRWRLQRVERPRDPLPPPPARPAAPPAPAPAEPAGDDSPERRRS